MATTRSYVATLYVQCICVGVLFEGALRGGDGNFQLFGSKIGLSFTLGIHHPLQLYSKLQISHIGHLIGFQLRKFTYNIYCYDFEKLI